MERITIPTAAFLKGVTLKGGIIEVNVAVHQAQIDKALAIYRAKTKEPSATAQLKDQVASLQLELKNLQEGKAKEESPIRKKAKKVKRDKEEEKPKKKAPKEKSQAQKIPRSI